MRSLELLLPGPVAPWNFCFLEVLFSRVFTTGNFYFLNLRSLLVHDIDLRHSLLTALCDSNDILLVIWHCSLKRCMSYSYKRCYHNNEIFSAFILVLVFIRVSTCTADTWQ